MADDARIPDAGRRGADERSAPGSVPGEPRPNWLRRILGQGPAARRRLGEAVAALLGTALVALAAIGGLLIWHLVRRGRIIREGLDPPRIVRMPERTDRNGDRDDDAHDHDDVPPA